MCVICISESGVPLPSKNVLRLMWNRNPHGAGYMFTRSKYVYIRKGFMTFDEFYCDYRSEGLTNDDAVVFHFRISTQGGINPEMTHPFVLSDRLEDMKILRTRTNVGICHNGIISLTSNGDREYSDTAHYITKYLYNKIDTPLDFKDADIRKNILSEIHSKMAILDYAGRVTKIGEFHQAKNGLEFSNTYFIPYDYIRSRPVFRAS